MQLIHHLVKLFGLPFWLLNLQYLFGFFNLLLQCECSLTLHCVLKVRLLLILHFWSRLLPLLPRLFLRELQGLDEVCTLLRARHGKSFSNVYVVGIISAIWLDRADVGSVLTHPQHLVLLVNPRSSDWIKASTTSL